MRHPLRLVQLTHPELGRHVALVQEPGLTLLGGFNSIYAMARSAISLKRKLSDIISNTQKRESLSYDELYTGQSKWSLLPAFDHPDQTSRCFVTGTGLTHKASAENRQSMHESAVDSDSMKMYRIGLEGGRPGAGEIGAAPEWFYKGTGQVLRAHGQTLDVPCHGNDGGDEAEIAGIYIVGDDGQPYRVGLAQGNEFSDHVMEAKNYLYLAASKLRVCSLGPELIVDPDFGEVTGKTWIERDGRMIWSADLHSGEKWMSHTLANLEHHHFKHDLHRSGGDVHIHFFGADNFSFRQRLRLEEKDVMVVAFDDFGRALRNPIHVDCSQQKLVSVRSI